MMQWTWPNLYNYDPQLKPVLNAELASAEVVSTDPQVVVITLNPKAIWSDGTAGRPSTTSTSPGWPRTAAR